MSVSQTHYSIERKIVSHSQQYSEAVSSAYKLDAISCKCSKSERGFVSLLSYSDAVYSTGKLDVMSSKCLKSKHGIVSLSSCLDTVSFAGKLDCYAILAIKIRAFFASLFSIQACLGLPLHMGVEPLDCVTTWY